jgi:hypothetical protein
MKKGMGRNPKAAREWRRMREAVEAEIERRPRREKLDSGSAVAGPAGCSGGR